MAEKYDVAILGVWYGCNYGSIATYYALHCAVRDMGKSVLMVHRPWIEPFNEKQMEKRHAMKFARKHYNISKAYNVEEISELNGICDTFLLGSDQLWNYGVTKIFGHSYFLDFAQDDKNKVAYATSFGGDRFLAPGSYAWKALSCMRRMNYISVREEVNVNMCKKLFGVEAVHVLDPILLGKAERLAEIAKESCREKKERYIAAYVLDPTPEKTESLLWLAEKLDKEIVVLLDGWPHLFKKNKEKMGLPEYTISNLTVNDWIFYIQNSDFVLTDSFHDTCMALLFEKEFYAISNPGRGASRFESLVEEFGLRDNYVHAPEEIMERELPRPLDYKKINGVLEEKRKSSLEWLRKAICAPQQGHSSIVKNEKLYPLRMLKSILLYETNRMLKSFCVTK